MFLANQTLMKKIVFFNFIILYYILHFVLNIFYIFSIPAVFPLPPLSLSLLFFFVYTRTGIAQRVFGQEIPVGLSQELIIAKLVSTGKSSDLFLIPFRSQRFKSVL